MKSRTCYSKKNSMPLSQYYSQSEAELSAEYLYTKTSLEMVPYHCGKCEYWHLSPKGRCTPSVKCNHCTGSDGKLKDTYRTQVEAMRRADILQEEKGIHLNVYRCEHGNGWHLTKCIY